MSGSARRRTLAAAILLSAVAASASAAGVLARVDFGTAPPYEQQASLTGNDVQAGDNFGFRVAVSGDGSTMVVGGDAGSGSATSGGVWFFGRSGSSWTQEGSRVNPGGFSVGQEVSISCDGTVSLIAGAGNVAWIYTRSGGSWAQAAKLSAPILFSTAALACDGSTAVLSGASATNQNASVTATFVRSGSGWQEQSMTSGDYGLFAVSADASTALANVSGSDGEVAVLTRNSSGWEKATTLTPAGLGNLAAAQFGASGALAADGSVALVGAPHAPDGGGAWVFARHGSTWRQVGGKLRATGVEGIRGFGYDLALAGNGQRAVISSETAGLGGKISRAWLFSANGNAWAQQGGAIAPTDVPGHAVEGCCIGGMVGVSSNGRTLVFGSPNEHSQAGVVRVFVPAQFPLASPRSTNTKSLTVTSTKAKSDGSADITVAVTRAGVLTATGSQIVHVRRQVARASAVDLHLRLKRALRPHNSRRAKIALTFSAEGSTSSITTTVTFRRP